MIWCPLNRIPMLTLNRPSLSADPPSAILRTHRGALYSAPPRIVKPKPWLSRWMSMWWISSSSLRLSMCDGEKGALLLSQKIRVKIMISLCTGFITSFRNKSNRIATSLVQKNQVPVSIYWSEKTPHNTKTATSH